MEGLTDISESIFHGFQFIANLTQLFLMFSDLIGRVQVLLADHGLSVTEPLAQILHSNIIDLSVLQDITSVSVLLGVLIDSIPSLADLRVLSVQHVDSIFVASCL